MKKKEQWVDCGSSMASLRGGGGREGRGKEREGSGAAFFPIFQVYCILGGENWQMNIRGPIRENLNSLTTRQT